MTRKLWRFHGGLHLPEHKHESTRLPVAEVPLSSHYTLPLQQHIGEAAKPLVAVGDRVLRGQIVAQAEGYVSAPLHAPTSGTVVAIEERPVPHPSGMSAHCIVIESDGEDRWFEERKRLPDYAALDASELRNLVRDAGIVGLGGAGFPSFIKLNPGARTAVDTLILNGAECEPYITCDDMLMRDRPDAVISGARIMRHALQARHCLIGIEDNKPEAAAALREALSRSGRDDIEVVVVPTLYPTGGEKQLIKILTGREVPQDGLPLDTGVVCHNVATAAAVHDAVIDGIPLIERLVTISGEGVREPRNLRVRIGAPVADLIEFCGGYTDAAERLLMGGPMMGFALPRDDLPLIKTANCFLAMRIPETPPALACIRCGRCSEVCPVSLLPQQLYWFARARDFDKIQDYSLFTCIECGCCAHVCPSHIPLVQYYRFAKTEIWAQEREREKADQARRRHEARSARIEQEKAEREAKLKKKREALKQPKPAAAAAEDDPKKAAIKAALERVKAKQGDAPPPKNTDDLTPAQQQQIDEANARRAQAQATDTEENG